MTISPVDMIPIRHGHFATRAGSPFCVTGARVSDHADAFEKPTLLQHWPGSPHYTAHDRIVTFRERSKVLEKIAADIGTNLVKTRA
jgi:hypothetical protein